jgi:hypothetical protein
MNFKNWLLQEVFDTVFDFLLNPEHRNKTWEELMQEFKASGGQIIGQGKFGQVFTHPQWKYVLKMYNDKYYTSFVRFAYRTNHSAFPKFYGLPQKIVPFYKRFNEQAVSYIVRMEKLNPITDSQIFNLIRDLWWEGTQYIEEMKYGTHEREYEKTMYPDFSERRKGKEPWIVKIKHYERVIAAIKQYPALFKLFEGIKLLHDAKLQGMFDFHANNFMQRNTGELVIIDPLWAGSNPYADYDAAMKAEIGYEGDDYDREPELIGGQLPKKIKKKITKIQPRDDIPF